MTDDDFHPEWTQPIMDAAIAVHAQLGPGLLESAYQVCLAHELGSRGIEFAREVPLPITYKGVRLDCGYRMDFVVDRRVIIEVKSVERLDSIHTAQALTYLKLSGLWVAMIINFNTTPVYRGVRRLLLPESRRNQPSS